MNKKIKLSLISSLVTVSSIGIILPIASCSSSSNLDKKIIINHSNDENVKAALALAIAKIGNPDASDTNGNIILKQFNIITREYNLNDATVWTALGNFFTFDSGISFNDVVEKATISGEFGVAGSEIKINITLTLKKGYVASDINKLTLSDLKIGVVANDLTITHSTNASVKDALALAIAKTANSSATNTNGNINLKQFNIINNKEYFQFHIDVWTALGNFFTFDSGISFNDVVEKATVSGTFPEIGSEVKVKIVLTLKNGYVATDSSKLTLSDLKIGSAASNELTVTQSTDANLRETLGLEIAKIGNPSVTDTNGNINVDQFNRITRLNYTSNDTRVWNALGNFFSFGSDLSFNDVVEFATVNGTLGVLGSEIKIKVVLNLKSGYLVSNISELTLNDLKIGLFGA